MIDGKKFDVKKLSCLKAAVIIALMLLMLLPGSAIGINPIITKLSSMPITTGAHNPDIAVASDGTIHVVYEIEQNGRGTIYYARSTDDGYSFDQYRISSLATDDRNPGIAVDSDGNPHIVWESHILDSYEDRIVYRRSYDQGRSFDTSKIVVGGEGLSYLISSHPDIAVRSNIVHIVFYYLDNQLNEEHTYIKYCRSTDGGQTFGNIITVSDAIYTCGLFCRVQ